MRGSIRDFYIGWVGKGGGGRDGLGEKVIVQNCGRALAKPKNHPGTVVLAP